MGNARCGCISCTCNIRDAIRPVPNGQERLREGLKHGFKKAIVPAANAPKGTINGIQIIAVKRVQDVIDNLF